MLGSQTMQWVKGLLDVRSMVSRIMAAESLHVKSLITLLKVRDWMSIWSGWHSGHASVIWIVIDRAFAAALHFPYKFRNSDTKQHEFKTLKILFDVYVVSALSNNALMAINIDEIYSINENNLQYRISTDSTDSL